MDLQPAGNNNTVAFHQNTAGGFCHDPLWDSSRSWYTQSSRPPDLTECFKWTALIWTPAIFLAICLPFYCMHYVRHRRRRRHCGHGGPKAAAYVSTTTNVGSGGRTVPSGAGAQEPKFVQSKNFMRSPLFVAKIACYILFIGSAAVQWLCMIFDGNSSAAAITGGCIEIAALFLALTITNTDQRQLRRTSGILFCFFGLVFVAHSARFYSAFIQFSYFGEISSSSLNFVCETLMFVASGLLALLHCFADTYGRVPYDKDETPRATASFLSQLTFAWLTPLLWRTWRKSTPLEQSDLWTLKPQDQTHHIYATFDQCWHSEIERTERLNGRVGPRRVTTKQITVSQEVALVQKNEGHHMSKNEVEIESETTENSAPLMPVPAGGTAKSQHEPSLHRAMFNMVKYNFFISACMNLCYITTVFLGPLLLKALIQSVVDSRSKLWQGMLIAVLLCVTIILGTIVDQKGSFLQWNYGLRLKSAAIAAVYRKAMRISNDTRQKYTVGELVNLVTVDAENMFRFPMFGTALSTYAPIVIVVAIIFLIHELGWAALAGVAFMAIIMPLNGWVANIQRKHYTAQLERKDERIKLTSEVLNGIKLLKFYAWETSFVGRLNALRLKELILLRKAAFLQAVSLIAWDLSPFFVSLLSFGAFVLASPENVLTVEKTFVSLLLMNILSIPLGLLPMAIQMLTQFLVSVERVRKFLLSDELTQVERLNFATQMDPKDDIVRITNASFAWSKTPANNKPVLADIDLRIKSNSLTAIVGHVGAGKSSLCAAVLGQLDRLDSGETATPVYIAGVSVAYVPQQAWIQNASVRDNILFGHAYNAELYEQVLEACALLPDLEIFPARDATEIGEKGLNLSGGQKQRVSLARAAYSNAQLVVLDDPLSAVDAHVAKHISEKLLSNDTGLLRHKTRILATHSISFLPYVDQIIVVDHGRIAERGTYRELLAHKGAFAVFLRNYLNDPASTSAEGDDGLDENTAQALATAAEVLANDAFVARSSEPVQVPLPLGTLPHSLAAGDDANKLVRRQISRQTTVDIVKSRDPKSMDHAGKEESKKVIDGDEEDGRLLTREATSRSRVHNSVYMIYARFASYSLMSLTILCYLGYAGMNSVSQIWLARWSAAFTAYEQQQDGTHRYRESFLVSERNYYLLIYALLGSGQAVFLLASAVTFAVATTRASRCLHSTMLDRILHAPMSFFDTTPTGRILDRFSKDLDVVDVTLPPTIQGCLECVALMSTAFFVICFGSPWFIAAVPVLILMYGTIQRFFVTTNCQLRRLELIARGPLLSFFTETVQGLQVVRAMQAQRRFIRDFESSRLDYAATPLFCNAVCNRWISMYSSVVGAFCILVAAVCVLMLKGNVVGDAAAASVLGLVLSSAISITGPMQWGIRVFSKLDTDIVSVERIDEYSKVEQERRGMDGPLPTSQWPEHGKIEFNKYKTRYRPGLRLVLNGITAQVKPGEKVGVVGRTGAGKSSLTMALFRLIEASGDSTDQDTLRGSENGGYIAIDGVDIAQLSLDTLRSRLTILPQEPMLFSGTLRFNLDPGGAYTDAKVWEALEHSHLKSWVKSHSEGLEFVVAEEGSNMSVGQRQLVCLARALLRKTRVLVLDEATAAVDVETDGLIQTTIRREFAQATVLTIAHRINTILDYDRVMVLEDGKVKEIGTPSELLQDEQSQFWRLARDANIKGGH